MDTAVARQSASRRRINGVGLAAITAVVSGLAVFINGYGVRAWTEFTDATTYTTVKNAVAALLLIGLALTLTRHRSPEGLTRPSGTHQWIGLAALAVVGGSIAFALFFEGLAHASSAQAAFIHKTLVVWVAILAVVVLRERLGGLHLLAIGLLVVGQATLVGGVSEVAFGSGERMMLAATLLWSVEVVVAKRLLGSLSAATVALARMAGGAVVLIAWIVARGSIADLAAITPRHLGWVVVTGSVLAVYVGSWYAALARAQAIDVTAVLVAGAIITALLRTGVQGAALPSPAGLGLVAAGACVIGLGAGRRSASAAP